MSDMMTGAFVRIKRDDKWQNVDIALLTDDELDVFAEQQEEQAGWRWAKFLAGWIRDNVVVLERNNDDETSEDS